MEDRSSRNELTREQHGTSTTTTATTAMLEEGKRHDDDDGEGEERRKRVEEEGGGSKVNSSIRSLIEEAVPPVDETLIRRLVFAYLIRECYEESALSFHQLCIEDEAIGSKREEEWAHVAEWWLHGSLMKEREHLRQLISEGNIEEAYNETRRLLPNMFGMKQRTSRSSSSSSLLSEAYFLLQCQRFIEKVRSGDVGEALEFAQNELSIFHTGHEMKLLQDHIVLLAYQDPNTSPMGDLLSQRRREEVANVLSSAILGR
jgi:hypothetical protein